MNVVPKSKRAKVAFFGTKVQPWTDRATQIGTTAQAVADMSAKLDAAADAIAAQDAAHQAAKASTEAADQAVAALDDAGTDIIKQIRAKAAVDGDSIYALAEIPSPAVPAPIPAPGKPEKFSATLVDGGALLLKWKCPNPAGAGGTMYQVARSVGAGGAMEILGVCGERHWLDSTLPAAAGAAEGGVTYRITATRSTVAGLPAEFLVKFGVSGGAATATVTPRMAA